MFNENTNNQFYFKNISKIFEFFFNCIYLQTNEPIPEFYAIDFKESIKNISDNFKKKHLLDEFDVKINDKNFGIKL